MPNVRSSGVAPSTADRAVVRRRQHSRVALLKRRTVFASLLGFAAFFGLAAGHAVKGAAGRRSPVASSRASAQTPTTFFDQKASDFSFDDAGSEFAQPSVPQSQPSAPHVAQTSVS